MAQNLKTGDTVKIISGSHKGESGKIVKMDRSNHKALVENIGVRERHVSAGQFRQAGKKTVHLGIDLSNLKLTTAAKQPEKKSEKKATKTKKGAK
ncbi:KOW motif-containing protein [Candidatus Saccharibacteria bacterium]|nr:KOW motif-containing protein [Candidatus Saccharibacteria bacterium]